MRSFYPASATSPVADATALSLKGEGSIRLLGTLWAFWRIRIRAIVQNMRCKALCYNKAMQKLFAFLLLVVAGLVGYVYWATRDLPSITRVLQGGINPSHTTQIYAADGSVILSNGRYRHQDVSLERVSPHVVDALLATEDRRFYQHPGVDPIGLVRAIFRDVKSRKMMEGGSTLTQQLARNLFLSNERSLKRKVREAVLAIKLEQKLSKPKLLAMYLNTTYFGEGAYGIDAASETYFNKKASELSIEESALLAGMPQAPTLYSPFQNPATAKRRRDEVLTNMVEAGKLDATLAEGLRQKPLIVHRPTDGLSNGDRAPFFNRYVLQQVKQQFDLDEQSIWQSGLKIYSTLQPYAQSLAVKSVRSGNLQYGRNGRLQQAALLSLNPSSGAILAYVGGKDYGTSQFDRVSQALRSPGSLFKLFTYATAIEKGFAPGRVYLDEPVQFGTWRPQNFDKGHHGYMTMARALATSNNIIAVKILNEIGPPDVIELAHRMGLKADLENNLSLTLGGSGTTLLDMTSAFGVIDNQGVRAEPYAIDRIVDAEGRTVYQHEPRKSNVLERSTTDTLIAMLQGVVQYGTGHAADIGRPVAGKTGTSDNHRDAWFIGFTPEMVTGVWVGNDDNSSMSTTEGAGMTGGALPAEIWRNYMRAVLADRLVNHFDLPYSKPLDKADFFTYKVENLSKSERYNPAAAGDTPPEDQGGIIETSPADTPPPPPADGLEDPIPPEETGLSPKPPDVADPASAGQSPTMAPEQLDSNRPQPGVHFGLRNPFRRKPPVDEAPPEYPTSTPGNTLPPDNILLRPSRRIPISPE
jgi:penicillin-binding protein 1A